MIQDKVDIYRIVDKKNVGFIHEEVCRSCAEKKQKEGFKIEFDKHLYRYIEEIEGITYYIDGSEEENPEIICTQCEGYLYSESEEALEGSC